MTGPGFKAVLNLGSGNAIEVEQRIPEGVMITVWTENGGNKVVLHLNKMATDGLKRALEIFT